MPKHDSEVTKMKRQAAAYYAIFYTIRSSFMRG